MTLATNGHDLSIVELRATVDGTVIAPEDPGYDAARATLYGPDLRPAVIVRAAGATDVGHVVRLVAATGLELAVRSGGHSAAGHGTTEGGIQLDLSAMKALDVDVEGRTAWAETGLTAGEVTTALDAHGLAVGFGDTGSVGIGGITTGGGIGFLVRKHGLTIDSVLAADVVTADGEMMRTDPDHHPDLFWAVRGGGGNFGVVTRFQYRLHELPGIVGGMLFLPATAETVAGFIAAAEAAPEELSTIANVMPCPPMPFVPAEHHGSLVIMGMLVYAGDEAAGQAALAPFRSLATPIADLLRPMPYAEMYPPEEDGPGGGAAVHDRAGTPDASGESAAGAAGEAQAEGRPNGHPSGPPIAASRIMFLDRIDRAVAAVIVDRLETHMRDSGAVGAVAQLRVLGGELARVPVEATAFAHRSSRIMVALAALVATAAELPEHAAWTRSFAAEIEQDDRGAYVNFVGDEGPERVRAAYPGATWDRLVAVKQRYDPTNLFHRNQNIPITGESTPRQPF